MERVDDANVFAGNELQVQDAVGEGDLPSKGGLRDEKYSTSGVRAESRNSLKFTGLE